MRTDTTPPPGIPAAIPTSGRAPRPQWPIMVMALMLLTGAFSIAAVAVPATAHASSMAVDQCNGHGPGTQGATTALRCTVYVVNTISGTSTYSRTVVTRQCTLGPCSTPNGTFITDSVSLVTDVRQCNTSDNDAAHAIKCYVDIVNNVGRSTLGAQPLSAPSVKQCVGSGKGGGGMVSCQPSPVSGDTISQCNGSGNGGGGKVHCTVDRQSSVSAAIPIKISQCNGTGNVGGSGLSCNASVITRISDIAPVAVPKATSAPTTAAQPTPSATPSATTTPPQSPSPTSTTVAALPASPAATGGPTTSSLLALGAGLVLAAAIGTLLYRRFAPDDLFSRFARKT